MRSLRVVVLVLELLGVSSVAWAQEFSEGFESYTAGASLHGVGGWKGWDNVPGTGAPASNKFACTGKNSVEILGTSDLVHQFTCAGGKWTFSLMQYIPSGTTGTTWVILMNVYSDGGTKDRSVDDAFNLDTGIVRSSETGDTLPIVYDKWVEVKYIIDLVENTVDIYYNGKWFTAHQWDDTKNGTFQAVDLYSEGASSIYCDDVKLTRIPNYKAQKPDPEDGAAGVVNPMMKWIKGDYATGHNVYFGTTPDLTATDLKTPTPIDYEMYYHFPFTPPPITSGATYYWRVDEIRTDGSVATGDVWSWTSVSTTAYASTPANGAKWVDPNADLSWKPSPTATSHKVYFGSDQAAVVARNASTLVATQAFTTFDLPPLAKNTTYYWAVDELNGGVHAGDLWSFTVGGPAGGVRAEYFRNTSVSGDAFVSQIEPCIDHQWGEGEVAGGMSDTISARWTADLVISVADTYTFTTNTDDGVRVWLDNKRIITNWTDHSPTDNSSRPIKLEPGIYPLRMEWYEQGGGATARLFWQTPTMARQIIPGGPLEPPLWSHAFYPTNGDASVPVNVTLIWKAGEKAVKHNVYFGEDEAAVAAATPAAAAIFQASLDRENVNFTPGTLEWGKTYYWRVDEVNDASADSPWKGMVWSFTTADFVIVDNFEGYTNDSPNRIFQTWSDGQGFSADEFFATDEKGNGSTAAVGRDIWSPDTVYTSIAEVDIIHGGKQAMPMDYNNLNAPYYAEATRTWKTGQDWTVKGGDTLVLYVTGQPSNKAGKVYVTLEDTTPKSFTVSYADDTAVTAWDWIEWKIPLNSFANVNATKIRKMSVGVGNRAAPTRGTGGGTIFFDDIKVIKP